MKDTTIACSSSPCASTPSPRSIAYAWPSASLRLRRSFGRRSTPGWRRAPSRAYGAPRQPSTLPRSAWSSSSSRLLPLNWNTYPDHDAGFKQPLESCKLLTRWALKEFKLNEHISRKRLHRILTDLAEELDVPPSKYREAKKRYDAVGTWLDADDSELACYEPSIYPQGSFALGTAVKP